MGVISAANAHDKKLLKRHEDSKMTIEIGRLCVKTAGRDAKGKCVIIDTINDNYVVIDGQVRRRKCNINHLEPLDKVLNLKKGALHEDVVHEFKKLGIELVEKKSKPRFERPKKLRRGKKEKSVEEKIGASPKTSETKKPKKEKVIKKESKNIVENKK